MKILGTGLSGLVGSRFVELLNNKYDFENLSLDTGIDIADRDQIIQTIAKSDAPLVLHLAAKTDVNGCEKDKEQDLKILGLKDFRNQEEEFKNKKTAWGVNVFGTKNIVDACIANNKKLIYVSTDFVFDGETKSEYSEEDKPNPINWYAITKYEGEKNVQNSNLSYIIARIAYPYRAIFTKKDFVRNLIDRFMNKKFIAMVTDHIMTPTFIDDIAFALDKLLKNNSKGIFHIVGSSFVSPYEAAIKIAEVFNFDKTLIKTITRKDFFKHRAPRPFRLAIKNDKIQKLGIKMKTFEEGLREVRKQQKNF